MRGSRIFVALFALAAVAGLFVAVEPLVRAADWVVMDGDTISGTPVSQSRIDLSWSASYQADDPNQALYRCVGSGCGLSYYTTIGSNHWSYPDTGLSCGTTYRYRVVSAYGQTNDATVTTDACTPGTPTIGTASPASQTAFDVNFTTNSPYTQSGCQAFGANSQATTNVSCPTNGSNTPQVGGYTCNSSDGFQVRAYVNTNGRIYYSGWSNYTNSATTDACTPPAPTSLVGQEASATQINLSWMDGSSNETGFEVYRCSGQICTPTALVGSTGANSTSFSSTGLSCSTWYGHRVRAYVDTNGRTYYSSYTSTVYNSTLACDTTPPSISFNPATPRNVWQSATISVTPTASDASGVSYTRHCWVDASADGKSTCDPGDTAGSTFTNSTAVTYGSDTGVNGVKLCVRARDAYGNWSSIDGFWDDCDGIFYKDSVNPSTPSTLAASSYVNAGSFTMSWTAASDALSGLQRYHFDESIDGGINFSFFSYPSTSSQALSKTQGTYVYRVRAEDNAGNLSSYSTNSAEVTVDTTAPTISGPSDAGTYASSTSLVFTSSPSDTGGSGLSDCTGQIDVNNTDGAGLVFNGSVGTDGDHAYGGLEGNTYYYRVSCSDAVGNSSGWSAWTDGITIDLTAPTLQSKTSFSGWYTANQTSTFTYTDSLSGIASGGSPTCTISTEGTGQTCSVTPNACDNAGNCNTTAQTSNGANLDKTAPTPNPSTGSAVSTCAYDGLSRSVTWTISVSSDATSDLDPSPYSFTNGTSWQSSNGLAESGVTLATTTKTVKARDVAGLQTTAGTITANQVSCVAPPSSSPSSPSGSLDGGQGLAILSWSEVSNSSGYLIEESADGGGTYSVVGNNTSNTLTTFSYSKYGQVCPKDYLYRVIAYTNDPSYDTDTNCPVGYRDDRKCSVASSVITSKIRYCTGHFFGE